MTQLRSEPLLPSCHWAVIYSAWTWVSGLLVWAVTLDRNLRVCAKPQIVRFYRSPLARRPGWQGPRLDWPFGVSKFLLAHSARLYGDFRAEACSAPRDERTNPAQVAPWSACLQKALPTGGYLGLKCQLGANLTAIFLPQFLASWPIRGFR